MATKRLELSFSTAAGRKLTISVPDPREDVTAGDVQAVMTTVVEKNIFTSAGGEITGALGARITTRDVTDLITV